MPRNIVRDWKALENEDLSVDIISNYTDAAFLDKGRVLVEWTADQTNAQLIIEISNDKENWRSIVSTPIVLNSTSGSHEIAFPVMDFGYMRFRTTSGTVTAGSINISLSASTEGK